MILANISEKKENALLFEFPFFDKCVYLSSVCCFTINVCVVLLLVHEFIL